MSTASLVRARHKGQPAGGVPLWRLIPPHRFRTSTPEPTPLAAGQERPVRPGWLNQCIHCWGWVDDPRHWGRTPQTAAGPTPVGPANGDHPQNDFRSPASPLGPIPHDRGRGGDVAPTAGKGPINPKPAGPAGPRPDSPGPRQQPPPPKKPPPTAPPKKR
jgi:hypothetical protein